MQINHANYPEKRKMTGNFYRDHWSVFCRIYRN